MRKFSTDHYFHIGSSHYTSGKPCEDYALSASNELVACAIVSDGCSGGRNTDIGSRILTLSTIQAIKDHVKASGGILDTAVVSITSRQQQIIGTSRMVLNLERSNMLATCIYAYLTQYGGYVHIQGDGVLAIKYRNGEVMMVRYEWDDNTPFYPSYGGGDIDRFIEVHGGDLNAYRLSSTTFIRNLEGLYKEINSKKYSLREGLEGITLNILEKDLDLIEFVAVFSDGVSQISEIDWKNAVFAFLSFKNSNGEFAKRRMIWEIKELKKIGKGPVDDIAYAVIKIEKSEEGEKNHG